MGLQVVRKERIAAKENREVASVLEKISLAENWQPSEFVPVAGSVGLSWESRPIPRSEVQFLVKERFRRAGHRLTGQGTRF